MVPKARWHSVGCWCERQRDAPSFGTEELINASPLPLSNPHTLSTQSATGNPSEPSGIWVV